MRIDIGREYITRAGHMVRILAIENSSEPIQGQIRGPDGWVADWWYYSGQYEREGEHQLDIVGYWEDEDDPPVNVKPADPEPVPAAEVTNEEVPAVNTQKKYRAGEICAHLYVEKKSFMAGRPTIVRACTVPDWPDDNFICLTEYD